MTDEKIDRIIAERIMGWKVWQPHECCSVHAPNGGLIRDDGRPGIIRRGIIPEDWSPSTNLAHAAEAEARLSGEQQVTYVLALRRIVFAGREGCVDATGVSALGQFLLATAPPAIRAKALAAVAGGGQDAPARPA